MALHVTTWGRGDPVIALHPLGLDGSAFDDLGHHLAERGLRTLAVDLPGFGRTPAPAGPLSPARLARPVIALARRCESRPTLVGISMGGRVALEAALRAPDRFRAVVAVAPFLPWRRHRWAFPMARLLSPDLAERIPVEALWPFLRWVANRAVGSSLLADDAVARSGARMVYYATCPATRRALVAAARGMALDPPFGREGLWTRLPRLETPATFLWGVQDRMVPLAFARPVAEAVPEARQLILPCAKHAMNGAHSRCLADAVLASLTRPAGSAAGLATVWPCAVTGETAHSAWADDPTPA